MVKAKKITLLLLAVCLLGCAAGSVKPLLDQPEFKAENQPVRTLRVLLITDDSYRKDEIEKWMARCSDLVEVQVGIRLEIVGWQRITWEKELNDIFRTHIRMAAETWTGRETFDVAVAPVRFVHRMGGGKLLLGAVDAFFWRYIFVREPDPNILLHELFHAFLLVTDHSDDWVMRAERSPYGVEWYWLTPEQRKVILRNKWRDFNAMPVTGDLEGQRWKEGRFYYALGSLYLQRREFNQAVPLLAQSLEMDPKFAPTYNDLAWILATADEAAFRNGQEAVRLALVACELSNWKNPGYFDTLAAAYARAGNFDKAIHWQEKALQGMKTPGNDPERTLEPLKPYEHDRTSEHQQRLNLYRMQKPWPPN
jgi:hypothetical protein